MVATEIACTDFLIQQRENNNKIKFDLYCRIYMDNQPLVLCFFEAAIN